MITREDMLTILDIVIRAENMNICQGDRFTCILDMKNSHQEFNLKLNEFKNSDDANFIHDFIGIQNNIDRTTGKMDNCFVPRYAS